MLPACGGGMEIRMKKTEMSLSDRILQQLKALAMITLGAFIYGISVALLLDPNNLAPGGITGIAVILSRFFPVQTGTFYLLLNVPVILLGLWKFGFRFLIKTIYGIAATSLFTNLLSIYPVLTEDPLIASVSGGILMAAGIGIIFKAGATTGGTDIIVKLLRKNHPHLKTGFLFLCMDFVIVTVSGFVFRDFNIAFYALLSVGICGWVLDKFLYGGDEARQILIISDHPDEIARKLLHDLDVGCTFLNGAGAWTGNPKKVILCVVHKRLAPQVEEVVKEEDPTAFLILGSANEIYGDGYKDIFAEKI